MATKDKGGSKAEEGPRKDPQTEHQTKKAKQAGGTAK